MAAISLDGVSKRYPYGHTAVRDVTLRIDEGELLVLVGPSGCGKSTVLRLIAGLETATSGRITIGDRDVTDLAPQQRDLAMVFQSYALYPHKSVRENMAFALEVRRMAAAQIDERVRSAAASLGIESLLDRKPAQLSGGQRQRVALGRAIVREPKAFLLDEPLSNLDPLLRADTRAELALLHRRLGATMIYVTHDQEEAMTLATRMAVMNDGLIEQIGAPLEIFEKPATTFVAQFVGTPSMNLWPGTWSRDGGAARIVAANFTLDAPAASIDSASGDGATIMIGVRPHDIDIASPGSGDLDGTVELVEALGAWTTTHVRVGTGQELVRVAALTGPTTRPGDRIALRFRRDRLQLFDAATGRKFGLRDGS
jgi:multiple sugar transport system ATP-binding protein